VTIPHAAPESPEPDATVTGDPPKETTPVAEPKPDRLRLRPAVAASAAQTAQAAQAAGRAVATGSRATLHAARRPRGRLVMGGLLIATLVAGTIMLGVKLVPTSSRGTPQAEEPSPSAAAPSVVDGGVASPSFSPFPSVTSSSAPPNAGLTVWADRLAPKVEIPPVALRAYAYAEYVLNARKPACTLRWTTIAAIGKVESNHGRVGASTLGTDGRALPPIIGPALDGKGGRAKVADTDAGALDNDRAWDHAVGPMQFLPTTWRSYAIDADSDGIVDPNDVDDAALAVASKLCEANKDLSQAANWTAAIKTFPDLSTKLQEVFDAANLYGQKSRS
jgi:Transglycosylase SLT domain